jgi:hypothetical protein
MTSTCVAGQSQHFPKTSIFMFSVQTFPISVPATLRRPQKNTPLEFRSTLCGVFNRLLLLFFSRLLRNNRNNTSSLLFIFSPVTPIIHIFVFPQLFVLLCSATNPLMSRRNTRAYIYIWVMYFCRLCCFVLHHMLAALDHLIGRIFSRLAVRRVAWSPNPRWIFGQVCESRLSPTRTPHNSFCIPFLCQHQSSSELWCFIASVHQVLTCEFTRFVYCFRNMHSTDALIGCLLTYLQVPPLPPRSRTAGI